MKELVERLDELEKLVYEKEVARMNIDAIKDALSRMTKSIEEQDKKINHVVQTLSTLQGELNGMNQRLAILSAKSFNGGATA
jgi:SMC interacting uncharacterized protein involved in chromosome segregation